MQVITEWSGGDWDLLVKSNRENTLEALRNTVERLVLPSRCTRMRQEILRSGGGGPAGERAGDEPRRALLGILLGNLRYHGYIYRVGKGWELSPFTPRQTHLVRLMSQGDSLKTIALHLGVAHSTTRRVCQAAMEATDTHTSSGLVGMALYEGWIPGRAESENLRRNLGDTLGPGYLTR